MASLDDLRAYLDTLVDRHERPAFIDEDPISIPHAFDDPRDQEVIGLYAALLAWGRRDVMLRKLEELCERMNHSPAHFVRTFDPDDSRDAEALDGFVHRTFQPTDAIWLTTNLSAALDRYGTVEGLFEAHCPDETDGDASSPVAAMLQGVSTTLLTINDDTPNRLRKHLARPEAGSACKRLNMYLRWMVRPGPVDLNLWSIVEPADLMLPVDVHVGRQARTLGLLERKTNDWKAVRRLTAVCRHFCPSDPTRYDFAFFGVGSQDESLDARFTGANRVDGSSLPTPR
ncbi:MAG: TIGR02757 family protein [Salinibacter sp.]